MVDSACRPVYERDNKFNHIQTSGSWSGPHRVPSYQHDHINGEQHSDNRCQRIKTDLVLNKRTAISGSGFHSSNVLNSIHSISGERKRQHNGSVRRSPKNCLNSFIVQIPQDLACSMPIISITRMTDGVPCPPNAPAGFSVALCKIFARSSSEYRPSEPRFSLNREMAFVIVVFEWFSLNVPSKGPL